MLKKLTLLALAAVTVSAFAQSTTTTTQTTQTTTTTSTAMTPGYMDYNMNATSDYDRYRQDLRNVTWLSGGDQYYFEKQLALANGAEEHAIIKAVYNLGGWATQLRWENGVARMNQEWPTYAFNRTTTVSSSTDTSGNTTTETTTTWTAPTGVYTWDVNSSAARPLRFAYEAHPRIIDYRTALEILDSGLDSTEAGVLNHWWMNADERAKDIMVRLISRQLQWVDVAPLRISYLEGYRDVQK